MISSFLLVLIGASKRKNIFSSLNIHFLVQNSLYTINWSFLYQLKLARKLSVQIHMNNWKTVVLLNLSKKACEHYINNLQFRMYIRSHLFSSSILGIWMFNKLHYVHFELLLLTFYQGLSKVNKHCDSLTPPPIYKSTLTINSVEKSWLLAKDLLHKLPLSPVLHGEGKDLLPAPPSAWLRNTYSTASLWDC